MTRLRNSQVRMVLLMLFLSLSVVLSLSAQPAAQRIRVGILVYEGVYDTEFIAPLDVFQHAATRSGGRLEVFTVSPEFGAVTTAEGLRIFPNYSFAIAPEIDWLIVPSGENYRTDIENEALIAWIRTVGHRAQVVHSNCWGAFLLGAAGLLENKEATTYPGSLDEFAERFPGVRVRRDQQLVDAGGAITSAGGVVSYDAALYLLEKHLGTDLAREVAEGLVIDWETRRGLYQNASPGAGR